MENDSSVWNVTSNGSRVENDSSVWNVTSNGSRVENDSSVWNVTSNGSRVENDSSVWNVTSNGSRVDSAWDTSMWTLTSPDGSRVERYIVEFECRVRSITFVEKYMSVSASGGTGRVAINVSCFGGLGQLYRVKVWAVSGPNISRALVCHIPDGQCREEEGEMIQTQRHVVLFIIMREAIIMIMCTV